MWFYHVPVCVCVCVCVYVGGCEPGYIYRVYGWEESVHCIVTSSNGRLGVCVCVCRCGCVGVGECVCEVKL